MSHDDPAREDTIASSADPAAGATLAAEVAATTAAALPARTALPEYELGAMLGAGGMGDVVLARDPTIGRHVAIKRMKAPHPTPGQIARFLREARIQARLEHPAIPPVHELGRGPDGQPYFAMKRLVGVTLADSLATTLPPPRARLLRVFADVCRAIEFAHARGVIHRDLKPANVMLGAYGEVYVLDWGLARVDDGRTEGAAGTSMAVDIGSLDDELAHGGDGETQAGALLGTPGYMAPEQARGARDVGPAADVYALGAILFEILAGEAFHPRGLAAALHATLEGGDGAPGHRRPERDVPPELDALCADALALEARARPTAAVLAARIEGYLDGDRDLEHRRALAAAELTRARELLDRGEPALRADAMRAAGRAVALDPSSRTACELVAELMLAPPTTAPPALAAELAALDAAQQQRQSRVAMLSFVAVLVYLATAALAGIRTGWFAGLLGGLALALMAFAWRLSRRPASSAEMLVTLAGNALLVALLSRTFGSLVIAPGVTCVMAVSLGSYPQLIARVRWVLALLVASWVVPIVLERAGAIASTWSVEAGAIVSRSSLVEIEAGSTTGLLIGANLVTFVVIGLFANALARQRREAQHRAASQAWHVRQFLPEI